MKIKPIPFKTLDKYKYWYFVVTSFLIAFSAAIALELTTENHIFTLNSLLKNTFLMWGFQYIASFWIYERARKNNEKMQKEMNDKQEEKA